MGNGLSSQALELSGRVLTPDDDPVADVDVWVFWLPDPNGPADGCLPATVQAIGIAPGDYLLEVTATESASGTSWSSRTPIAVSG